MKYLIKLILPPLFAFWCFALFIKFSHFFHHVDGVGSLGEDSVYGLIAYYKVFAPVQIVIALLTQFLIVMPLWRKILVKPKTAITIFLVIFFVCILFATGLAYIIWDPKTPLSRLIDNALFMTSVQMFYWVVDFMLLGIIDFKSFKKTKATHKQKEPDN